MHTPGPWTHSPNFDDLSLVILSSDGAEIAEVYQSNHQFADADLIANAPKLLTALENLVSFALNHSAYNIPIDEAQSVISKAKS